MPGMKGGRARYPWLTFFGHDVHWAARIWCENATLLTNSAWHRLNVPQKDFRKLQPAEPNELVIALAHEGALF
jgi:hypothetical protein